MTTPTEVEGTRAVTRRRFLRTSAAAGGAAVGVTGSATAQESDPFGGWFDGVSNYDGVVDRTGQSEVTVEVGAQGNNGYFAFSPAAVRVSPGTTVVWKWTGRGGGHNVVHTGGAFESQISAEAGYTFTHSFADPGVYKYFCAPHRSLGMKGAIVVGEDAGPGGSGGSGGGTGLLAKAATIGLGLLIVLGLLFTLFTEGRR